jgi:Cys-Gly metallodipeptidase DUG1
MPAPAELLSYIDASAPAFIARLSEAVAIPSISGDPAFRPHVLKMSDWLAAQLKAVGVTVKQVDLGTHVMDGQTLPLPPAILGRIGEDPKKKTVLVYGHFDVQPAAKSDGWDTEPFVLTEEKDGRLVGRGSSDDKGPVLGWLGVLQWHHEHKKEMPVNLVMCFEGMEENGSEGLDELVERERDGWFKGVDCVCIVSVVFVFGSLLMV